MKTWSKWLTVFLLSAGLLAATAAFAASVWVSVPSAPAADVLVIAGGNLTPFSTVTLRVVHTSGAQTEQYATIDADGALTAEYRPVAAGSYSVQVIDADGSVLGGGDFVSQ